MASRETNRVDDIDGARPKPLPRARESAAADIEGSRPRRLYHERYCNKPDSFCVHDIEGARPRKSTFRTTRRVDPLQPQYKLPSFEEIVYEEPRFLRDSFNVDDIEGTRPRRGRSFATRDSYNVRDIAGTHAGWKPHHVLLVERIRKQGHSRKTCSLDVSDIIGGGFKTRRCVDPLRPTYRVHGMDVEDCPTTTAPRHLARHVRAPFFSLVTEDIKGAKGDSASVCARLRVHQRKHFRDANNVSDIEGARPEMQRNGLRSNRRTNPLQPRYTYLHGSHDPTPPLQDFFFLAAARKPASKPQDPTARASCRSSSSKNSKTSGNKTGFDGLDKGPGEPRETEERRPSNRSRRAGGAKPNAETGPAHAPTPKLPIPSNQAQPEDDRPLDSTRSAPGANKRSEQKAHGRKALFRPGDAAKRSRPASAHPRAAAARSARSLAPEATATQREARARQAEINAVRNLPEL